MYVVTSNHIYARSFAAAFRSVQHSYFVARATKRARDFSTRPQLLFAAPRRAAPTKRSAYHSVRAAWWVVRWTLEHTSRVMCARQISGTCAMVPARCVVSCCIVPSRVAEQRTVRVARETRTEVETSRRDATRCGGLAREPVYLPTTDFALCCRRHGWPPAASLCRFSRLSFSPRERCSSPFTSKPRGIAPLEDFATLLARLARATLRW